MAISKPCEYMMMLANETQLSKTASRQHDEICNIIYLIHLILRPSIPHANYGSDFRLFLSLNWHM